jgi:hypothetical protein
MNLTERIKKGRFYLDGALGSQFIRLGIDPHNAERLNLGNPEVVKNADIENIYLISRCKAGYTSFTKPVEKKEVEIFLENEISISDLYIQNLLGV